MYGWMYRHLPGPAAFRVFLMLVVAAAIVAALFLYVFPWVADEFSYFDPGLE